MLELAGEEQVIDWIKGKLLGLVDSMNVAADPFQEFDRPANVVDTASLSDKADRAFQSVKANWLFGPRREFYWHMLPNDLGDMAIWQGCWTATCAFRGDQEALEKSLDGQEKLQKLGEDRLARGADAILGPHNVDPSRKYYTKDGYVWTDDCSESSLIGHVFGLWAAATFGERPKRPLQLALDLIGQLSNDGWRMTNYDGAPAKYGDLREGTTTAPIRLAARAMLLGLGLQAEKKLITGTINVGLEYIRFSSRNLGSITHPETHLLYVHPWYQDVIAYMALTVLHNIEGRDEVKDAYKEALLNLWSKTRKEGNTLYAAMVTFCAGPGAISPQDQRNVLKVLKEFNVLGADPSTPFAKLPGSVDLTKDPSIDKFTWGIGPKKRLVARQPVPVWMRPPQDFVWQRCPYDLKGESSYTYNFMDYALAHGLCKITGLVP